MDYLFELIKHLDKGEKAFFTKYSKLFSTTQNPIYLQLFRAIDKQKEYDEDRLIEKLKIKNFAYQKHYLYEHILTAIKLFHDRESDRKMIIHYCEIADSLMRKRLLDQADKITNKAEKLARKLNDPILLARVLQLKMESLKAPKEIGSIKDGSKRILDEVDYIGALFKDQMTINHLIIQMLYILRKGFPEGHKGATKELNEILNHEIIQDESRCVSFYDKTNRLILLNVIYGWKQDFEKSYEAKKEHLRLYEERPEMFKISPANFLTPHNNVINGAIQLNKVDEAILFINKFEELRKQLKPNSQLRNLSKS